MNTKKIPLLLCVKDMMKITGKSKSTVCRMIKAIRQQFNKKNRSPVTVDEFCEYTQLKEEKVKAILQ